MLAQSLMKTSPICRFSFASPGRKAVLAGDGEPAAWKAELLAADGARPARLRADAERKAARDGRAARACASSRAPGTEADLDGALIAVLETEDDAEAARFRAAARAAGALVNVIDRPEFCDFSFGSIVERSPLVIGVSTDGAAPVFAQAVRARIEAMFPETLRAWAEAARAWRPRFAGLSQSRRRAIWLDFADARVRQRRPRADRGGLSRRCRRTARPGRLLVVGTGAGARRRPDAARGAGAAGGRSCRRGRRRCRPPCAISAAARRASSACPQAPARPCARRRRRASPAGATVVVLVPGDGRGDALGGAEIVPGVAREPVRLRSRLLRGAGDRARRRFGARGGDGADAGRASRRGGARGSRPYLFDAADRGSRRRCGRRRAGLDPAGRQPAIRRCALFGRALRAAALRRVVYLSTVGVYGDAGGEWVDEASPLRAVHAARAGARRRGGGLARVRPRGGVAVDILRLGGIYGPGRSAFDKLREGTRAAGGQARAGVQPHPCRRHRRGGGDGRRGRASPGDVYNVVDGAPSRAART